MPDAIVPGLQANASSKQALALLLFWELNDVETIHEPNVVLL
jgi:hypothetical protein